MTPALLPEFLDKGQFSAVVAADQFRFRRIDGDSAAAEGTGDLDHVGQIIFALHVTVADAVEQIKRIAAVDGHQSAIAPGHLTLRIGRVLLLADSDQFAILDQQSAVTRRSFRMETDHGDISAGSNGLAGPVERRRGNQRHIAICDDDIVEAAFDGGAGSENRVSGALALRLQKSFNLKARQARSRSNIIGITPNDERHRADT